MQPAGPSPSFRKSAPLGRYASPVLIALFVCCAPVASASVTGLGASRPAPTVAAANPQVLLAAGKSFQPPARKPPKRGSSAELHGGSSAERYGGSSADRSGVAGRRDVRNRGVYARRERPRRDPSPNREQQREADERAEAAEGGGSDRQLLHFEFGNRRK